MSVEDVLISELCLGPSEIPYEDPESSKNSSKSKDWNSSDEDDEKWKYTPPFSRCETPPPAPNTPPSEEKKKEESATPEKEFKTPKELPIEIVVKKDTP